MRLRSSFLAAAGGRRSCGLLCKLGTAGGDSSHVCAALLTKHPTLVYGAQKRRSVIPGHLLYSGQMMCKILDDGILLTTREAIGTSHSASMRAR